MIYKDKLYLLNKKKRFLINIFIFFDNFRTILTTSDNSWPFWPFWPFLTVPDCSWPIVTVPDHSWPSTVRSWSFLTYDRRWPSGSIKKSRFWTSLVVIIYITNFANVKILTRSSLIGKKAQKIRHTSYNSNLKVKNI